jgi:uncharacterized protein YraI
VYLTAKDDCPDRPRSFGDLFPAKPLPRMGRGGVPQEALLTASAYIKIAMLMGVICVAVIFLLVYRLLQIPSEQSAAVALQASRLAASPAATQAPDAAPASPTATPTGISGTANAYPNVHSTPALNSSRLGVLQRGDSAEILGRTPDGVWLQIRYGTSQAGTGWVSADLMTLAVPVSSVPVVSP